MVSIKVSTPEGWVEVEAEVVAPGLAVHETVYELGVKSESYTITHIPSGCYLDWFVLKQSAIEAARELTTLGNWTSSRNQVVRFGKKKIKAILGKHQF